MKIHLIRNSIIAGALSTLSIVPIVAQGIDARPISAKDVEIIPISYTYNHWAEPLIEALSVKYDIESIFMDKNLNDYITAEDFQSLLQRTLEKDYDNLSGTMTREAVVYEFTKIWAEKTNQDLDSIATIKMLIYSDTEKIDPKYNHGITVAYMKDIAKGKGAGIFDPKAYVTYGEVAALLNNTIIAIENDLVSNNLPIVDRRFETKGTYEIKDEKVVFDFELINHYTESKELMFGSGQQFEIIITNESGEEVYRYSDGKYFTLALVYKNINPGDSLCWQNEWDMVNKEGEKLSPGKYKAKIDILVMPDENCEKIDEKQLTTSIGFSI